MNVFLCRVLQVQLWPEHMRHDQLTALVKRLEHLPMDATVSVDDVAVALGCCSGVTAPQPKPDGPVIHTVVLSDGVPLQSQGG